MPIYTQGGKMFTQNNKMFETSWKPSRIDGLIFWGNAEKINLVESESGQISLWRDMSGIKNDGVQDTTNNKPYYKEEQINGYPALHFSNTNNISISATIDNFTIITVIKSEDSDIVYEFGNDTDSSTGFYLKGSSNSIAVSKDGLTGTANIRSHSNNWLIGGWKIVTHSYGGSNSSHKLYVDDLLINTSIYFGYDDDPGSLNKTDKLYVGSKINGVDGFNGYIAEYLVFDKYLPLETIEQISNYLNNKYNIY